MRADRVLAGAVLGLAALAAMAALAWPGPASAQSITGYAQSQYQVYDQNSRTLSGAIERQRVERWVQTFELQHFATPRSDLRVMSSFRVTDLAYRGLPDQSRSPQGTIQVIHPWASLFAAYRPTTVTGGLGRTGVVGVADTGRVRTLTSRAQETVLTGQVSPPSWPRLDLAWTRRHRNRDELSAEESGVIRTARLGWSKEQFNVYSMIGDQKNERSGATFGGTQRTAGAGAALRLTPSAGSNLDITYDLTDARIGDPKRNSGSSRGHNASLSGGYRPGGISSWNGSWLWRRTELRGPRRQLFEDHEGTLQYALDPSGPFRFMAASGGRTIRRLSGERTFATSLSGVASLDGRVRSGWTGVAALTHVTNWEPQRGRWSVEALRTGTQMVLARGFELSSDAQVATSDDTTLKNVNMMTEANVRARLTPWRAFTAGWTARIARSGSHVLDGSASAARSNSWDLRWRPVNALELTGILSSAQARGGSHMTTRTASARWAAHPRLQLSGDWSRSNDERTLAGLQSISGREVASARLLALITRKLQLDASAGVADRGGPRENRQGTVTLTWAFGR